MLEMLELFPPLLMQPTPSKVKCYMYWGFTLYRTYYGPESDKQWEDEVLWQKAGNCLPKDYCKSREEYLGYLKTLDDLFCIDTREGPSLDGLDVRGIREVCCNNPPETERGMAGFLARYVLVADKAVFEAMEKGEYIIKVVAYDWDDDDYWGWMRIPTGCAFLLDTCSTSGTLL